MVKKDISIAHPLTLCSLMQGMCSMHGGLGMIPEALYKRVKDHLSLKTPVKIERREHSLKEHDRGNKIEMDYLDKSSIDPAKAETLGKGIYEVGSWTGRLRLPSLRSGARKSNRSCRPETGSLLCCAKERGDDQRAAETRRVPY